MSYGTPSKGRVAGAEKFIDSAAARVLPDRHRARCLWWGTQRLVRALAGAGAVVAQKHPGSPPLGIGNIGRARGGAIPFPTRTRRVATPTSRSIFSTATTSPSRRPTS